VRYPDAPPYSRPVFDEGPEQHDEAQGVLVLFAFASAIILAIPVVLLTVAWLLIRLLR
jgi:hypothetical protein